ncbi:hypothetical protein D3C76_611710 [compost metagenome]
MVIAEPLALFVQRHEEHLVLLQVLEDRGAVVGIAQGVAQLGGEAFEACGLAEKLLYLGRQLVDHFLQQIIADQFFRTVQRDPAATGQRFTGMGEQPQAQPGDPALTAFDQDFQRLLVHPRAVQGDQFGGFLGIQPQVLFVEFEQLPRQAQARQMPVRPTATGHQQHHAVRQVVEEELQAAVEHRALGQVIVVQHQQQRRLGGQALRQFVEQIVEPCLEGERLVPLTHLQQAHGFLAEGREMQAQAVQQAFEEAAGIAVPRAEAQPQAAPVRRQLLAELDGQRTLAEPRRRRHQHQPATQARLQALAEPRAGNVAIRQRRAEKAVAGRAGRGLGDFCKSREFSHAAWFTPARGRYVLPGSLDARSVLMKSKLLPFYSDSRNSMQGLCQCPIVRGIGALAIPIHQVDGEA